MAFHRYLESNLHEILADQEISLDDKVETLYDCSQFVAHDILDNPSAGTAVPRSQDLVNTVADFLFTEQKSFARFLKATAVDYHVYTHSVNVFVYSMMLARKLGLGDEHYLKRLGMGALLHDVGKSRVSATTLNSSGKLTDAQWREMRQHPVWGWEILKKHGVQDTLVLEVTRSHHEKLRGSGYPDGLEGDQIAEHVRLVTICDIFDALTTKRSYKNEVRSFSALKLMQEEMSADLDHRIFSEFVRLMAAGDVPPSVRQ